MTLSKSQWTGVAFAIAAVLVWHEVMNSRVTGDSKQWQESGVSIPFWSPGIPPGGVFDHGEFPWRYPYGPGSGTVVTRHRYPAYPGIEISSILRHGMRGFTAGPPQDAPWIAAPPSTAMW